jgi:ABC-type lipoprotein export system ATPase subunit
LNGLRKRVFDDRNAQYDLAELWRTGRHSDLETLRRQHVGYAPQRPHLLGSLSVEENVVLPLQFNCLSTAEVVDESLGALSAVDAHGGQDLLRVRDNRVSCISGGQAKRVGLARALVHAPTLLVLDEPTSDLDAHTADKVLRFLDGLRRRRPVAILMTTHHVALARKYVDLFYLMDSPSPGTGELRSCSANEAANHGEEDFGEALWEYALQSEPIASDVRGSKTVQ